MARGLEPQRVTLTFEGGKLGGAAEELIQPPGMAEVWNGVYLKSGEVTKRKGWRNILHTGVGVGDRGLPVTLYGDGNPNRLAVKGTELLWLGENYVYGLTPGRFAAHPDPDLPDPTAIWNNRGQISRFSAAILAEWITGSEERTWRVDMAACSCELSQSMSIVVWNAYNSDNCQCRVRDNISGSVIWEGLLTDYDALQHRVVTAVGSDGETWIHFFWMTHECGSGGKIWHIKASANAPWSWSAPEDFSSTNDAASIDVVVAPTTPNRVFVLYILQGTVADMLVGLYTAGAAGALTSQSYALPELAKGASDYTPQIAVDATGTHVQVIYKTVTDTQIASIYWPITGYTFGTAVEAYVSGPTEAFATRNGCSVCWTGRAGAYFAFAYVPSAAVGAQIRMGTIVSGVYQTDSIKALDALAFGRPFGIEGRVYQPVLRGSKSDSTMLEIVELTLGDSEEIAAPLDAQDPTPYKFRSQVWYGIGRFIVQQWSGGAAVAGWVTNYCRQPTVQDPHQPGRYLQAQPTMNQQGTVGSVTLWGFDSADLQRNNWAEYEGGTIIAGGVPRIYDGDRVQELGFAHRPQGPAGEVYAVQVAKESGHVGFPIGTYYIRVVYESVDNSGRRHQSAPSVCTPVSIAVDGTYEIQLQYWPIGWTERIGVRAVAYTSTDGLTFQRYGETFASHGPEDGAIEEILDYAKCGLTGSEYLYTDGGALEHAPPPCCRFVAVWKNRVWLAGGEDPSLIWYSKDIAAGTSPGFNEDFTLRVEGIEVTGLAAFDERLVIFTRHGIWWTSGSGPSDTDLGDSFAPPQRIQSEVGCVNSRSIVMTDIGMLFQSERGIELLDAGLGITFVGAAVAEYLSPRDPLGASTSDPPRVVLGVNYDPDKKLARWLVSDNPATDADTGTCVLLCLSTVYKAWSVCGCPNRSLETNDAGTTAVDLVRCDGRNYLASFDPYGFDRNGAMQECTTDDAMPYLDGDGTDHETDNVVSFWITTPWIKLDGLLGFQRIWRGTFFARVYGYPSMSIGYRHSYTGAFTYRNWNTFAELEDVIENGVGNDLTNLGVHIVGQQNPAIQFRFREGSPPDQGDDTPPCSANAATTPIALMLEYGIEPGTGRLKEGAKK